jgi:hypothetical protein
VFHGPWLLINTLLVCLFAQHVWQLFTTIASSIRNLLAPRHEDVYIPKNQRSSHLRALCDIFFAILKSWMKRVMKKIERTVGSLKTRRRKRLNYFDIAYRRPKFKSIRHIEIPLLVFTAMQEASELSAFDSNKGARRINFDTDSSPLKVDNCATRSLSPFSDDFISSLTPIPNRIRGIGGTSGDLMLGTIKWKIEDDDGIAHTIIIPNSIYAPHAPSRLLSPQHWAQEAKDNKPMKDGTWCGTYHDRITLQWKQRQYTRTVALDRNSTNVGTITTASGYEKYHAFCAEVEGKEFDLDNHPLSYEHQATDDEMDGESDEEMQETEGDEAPELRATPQHADFSLDSPHDEAPHIIVDEEDKIPQATTAEFLRWHHRLGHPLHKKIRALARAGILPK